MSEWSPMSAQKEAAVIVDGLRHDSTDRLDLRALTPDDVDAMHAQNADPTVWTHFPQGRHATRQRTLADVESAITAWQRDGLCYWAARLHNSPDLAGFVGIRLLPDIPAWNLAFRFAPRFQVLGLARETARAGIDAAQALRPEVPVLAYLLEHNTASKRLTERLGLQLKWRGPDVGNLDPDAIRLIYADRPVDDEVLARVAAR